MDLETIEQLAKILEIAAKIAALVIAGVWSWLLFVKRRQKYPRAKVDHAIQHRALPDDRVLIRVSVNVENIGEVLIEIASGKIWLQQVLPLTEELSLESNSRDNGEKPEVEWPLIAEKTVDARTGGEIEPGESDSLEFDFIVTSDITTVLVYSHFENSKKPGREIGWTCSTLYDIEQGDKLHTLS